MICSTLLLCSALLCACAGRVQTPTEKLSQVQKGAEPAAGQPPVQQATTVDGERYDPIADEAITTGALQAWRVALRNDKSTLSGEALAKARRQDEAEAMKQLEALAADHPNSSYLKVMMAQVKHHFKKEAEATSFYEEAMAKNRRDPMLTFKLANSKHAQGKLDDAVKYYREASRLQPEWADPKVGLARSLFTQDASSKEARDLVTDVLESTPDHQDALALQKEMAK